MEEKTKKRGWVKDAAIVFLAVLLILTFFSSTILNRSLPEVATEYVQEGTITSKVRGTGNVIAKENYDVTIDQTRKVDTVLVRVGDEVAVGDILFILQPGDSTELDAAKETLASLEEQYQRMLLNASEADYAQEDRTIAKARTTLSELRLKAADLLISDVERVDFNKAYAALLKQVETCNQQITAKQKEIDEINTLFGEGSKELKQRIWDLKDVVTEKEAVVAEKEAIVAEKEAVVEEKKAVVEEKQLQVDALQEAYGAVQEITAEKRGVQTALEAERDALQAQWNEMQQSMGSPGDPNYDRLYAAGEVLDDADAALERAKQELRTQQVLHESNYELLKADAMAMMEAKFRADNGIADDAELDIQQTAQLSYFTANNLTVYLAAAAQQHAGDELGAAYNAISAAESAVESAQRAYNNAMNAYDNAYYEYAAQNQSNTEYQKKKKALDAKQSEIDAAQARVDAAAAVVKAAEKDEEAAQKEIAAAQKLVDAAQKDVDAAQKLVDAAMKDVNTAQAAVARAQQDVADAQSDLSAWENGDTFSLRPEQAEQVEARKELQEQQEYLRQQAEQAKSDAAQLKADIENREADYKNAVEAVESQQEMLEDLLFNLEQQKKNDNTSQQLEALERKKLLDSIEKQKKAIEELSGEDSGIEVKARVAGTVQTISVSSGHPAQAGAVLATIEVPDLGYTLSFSVTNDQARRLHVGDTTTVSNYYWGSQINATLISIQTDPQNPQGSKVLTFDVTGDVTAGSSLTLSVGEKNANYDMVVPNSAIRSDVNGSFVLKVTAKNSPLGNRYYATRVDVNIVASDEKYSAISGGIESYDSVITTASRNAPISAGDQVRLADTNT